MWIRGSKGMLSPFSSLFELARDEAHMLLTVNMIALNILPRSKLQAAIILAVDVKYIDLYQANY